MFFECWREEREEREERLKVSNGSLLEGLACISPDLQILALPSKQ